MFLVRTLCLLATALFPALSSSAVADEVACGTLVQGVECVLFATDTPSLLAGGVFLLSDDGGFQVGDSFCVTGVPRPCVSYCQQGNGCFDVTMIQPAATPTPTPSDACAGLPCNGTCEMCPPCIGTVCPKAPCLDGHCEVVSGSCACVPGFATPDPSPTPSPAPPPPGECVGDCDGGGSVDIAELIRGVNIALGVLPLSVCPAFECSADCGPGPVPMPPASVACLIHGVNNAVYGCPQGTCTSDAACDDGNDCSFDRCTAGGCVHDCVCD